ncbi:hypothetical protein EV401DRAFT_2013314 [Pisolithus croceorrhizus]|nr:hypothetical protein EV401DRAFT_2013314 [Pisolithus croceorrhizus]
MFCRWFAVASHRHAVHSVPRRLLDLRRPLSKVSPSEADERLVTYEVVLPDDARLAISHNYEVANIRQIMSAPSQLESTSLVLAIGLDLFLTCISPSGTSLPMWAPDPLVPDTLPRWTCLLNVP